MMDPARNFAEITALLHADEDSFTVSLESLLVDLDDLIAAYTAMGYAVEREESRLVVTGPPKEPAPGSN